LEKIEEGLQKGVNLFHLYGPNLGDLYLFDLRVGLRGLEETLSIYFSNRHQVDGILIYRRGELKGYSPTTFEEVDFQQLMGVERRVTGFGATATPTAPPPETQSQLEEGAQQGEGFQLENRLTYLKRALGEGKRFLLLFPELDWEANLYSTGEQNLTLLREIRQLSRYQSLFIVTTFPSFAPFQPYNLGWSDRSRGAIYIGNPTLPELQKTLLRFLLRKGCPLPEKKVLEQIAGGFHQSRQPLREVVQVLNSRLQPGAPVTLQLFEGAFEKPTGEEVKLEDVVLNERLKRDIEKIVRDFAEQKEGALAGLILYGPPGTGKTYLAKGLANYFKMSFLAPTLSELKGEFIGESSQKIRRLFEEARANKPTLLFLDELDTLFPKRGGSRTDSFQQDMVNQFLVEVDGIHTEKGSVFVIGATNRLEEIDPAVRSRLSQTFQIPPPDRESRFLLIQKRFKKFNFSQFPEREEVLEKTEGLSGREIDNLVKWIKNSVSREEEIGYPHFLEALRLVEEELIHQFQREVEGVEISPPPSPELGLSWWEEIGPRLRERIGLIGGRGEVERLAQMGIPVPVGYLLIGEPGVGKSTLLREWAGEGGLYLVQIPGEVLVEGGGKGIEQLFYYSRRLAQLTGRKGVLLVIEGVEEVAGPTLPPIFRRTLLRQLEELSRRPGRLIVTATGTSWRGIDRSLIGPGRFQVPIPLSPFSVEEGFRRFRFLVEGDPVLETSGARWGEVEEWFRGNLSGEKVLLRELYTLRALLKESLYFSRRSIGGIRLKVGDLKGD
jgi:transitional endoplasmic reticulum ATPase